MPRISTRSVLLAMLGFVVSVPIALGVVVFLVRTQTLPTLTATALDEAERRWQHAAIVDYDLTIEIAGRRAGVVEISVRAGTPVSMTRDGVTPKRIDTWQAWTVAGMFETLHLECEAAAAPQRSFGVAQRSDVVQRSEFDAVHGLPRRYQRLVLGTDNEMGWTVTRFAVLDPTR